MEEKEEKIKNQELREFYSTGSVGLFYDAYSLHGIYETWHSNGRLKTQSSYNRGRLHGVSREWYDSGQIASETNYRDGMRDGERRTWYENGIFASRDIYQDDIRVFLELGKNRYGYMTGEFKWWKIDGTLECWGFYCGEKFFDMTFARRRAFTRTHAQIRPLCRAPFNKRPSTNSC